MKRSAGFILCVSLLLLPLGGCDVTTGSPTDASAKTRPRTPKNATPPATISSIHSTEKNPDAPIPAGKRRIYMINYRVGTIHVPTRIGSGAKRLWNYLDEEPLALQSTVLGLNGLRLGVGQAENWPDVERELKRMTGQAYRTLDMQALPGTVNPIVLKKDQGIQRLFLYYDDRTLRGEDYPPGDNLLSLTGTLNEDDPSKVLLTGMPQIRALKKEKVIVEDHGSYRFVSKPKFFPFTPLTFQVEIPKGGFLIIGPGIQSRRTSSLAHHFFTKTKNGLLFETLVILRPIAIPVNIDS